MYNEKALNALKLFVDGNILIEELQLFFNENKNLFGEFTIEFKKPTELGIKFDKPMDEATKLELNKSLICSGANTIHRWLQDGIHSARHEWMESSSTYPMTPMQKEVIFHELVRDFLKYVKIKRKPTKIYKETLEFITSYWGRVILPEWLVLGVTLTGAHFLRDEIIAKIPAEIVKTGERKAWCRERIKTLFEYDKIPPSWIKVTRQEDIKGRNVTVLGTEWPFKNGKPLVFKGQSKMKGDERVSFTFYDPDTGEETVIMQMH